MDFHTPVLLAEILEILNPQPNQVIVDATLGNGGHTLELLKKKVIVYGIDQDPQNLEIASNRVKQAGLSKNFHPVHGNFSDLSQIVNLNIHTKIDSLLLDLGLSKNQIKSENRGFSFHDEQSLDMRLDPNSQSETAENIINTYSFDQLYELFTKYAQEKYSKPLILRIIRQRQKSPIKTGTRLAEIIKNYYSSQNIPITRIHPATKIFLALKMAVNQELPNLISVMNQSLKVVKKSGHVAIITFHSSEDRLVKQFIRQQIQNNTITPLPKRLPSSFEISQNPLSRSSVLRSYTIN